MKTIILSLLTDVSLSGISFARFDRAKVSVQLENILNQGSILFYLY